MRERSELFWLRAIASLVEVIAPLSISEAERACQLVLIYSHTYKVFILDDVHVNRCLCAFIKYNKAAFSVIIPFYSLKLRTYLECLAKKPEAYR